MTDFGQTQTKRRNLSMLHMFYKTIIIVLISLVFFGCNTTGDPVKPAVEIKDAEVAPPSLKVGVTPNYPPIIFKQAKKISGVEADLAVKLAEELGRSLEFVELEFNEQIPALLSGKTDIIMSGLSVTKAREVRISFTDHYLKSGLLAAFRIKDSSKYNSIDSILNCEGNVGVVKSTTSAVFTKQNFPNIERIFELSKARDGGIELKRTVIDLFIHDAPSIAWLVSENEANLMGLWEPLNTEYMAWGINRDNQDLMTEVNNVIKKWKNDGTLTKTLQLWLPWWRFEK